MSYEIDERSAKNIATLVPGAQERARQFLVAANAALPEGMVAKIIAGNRTYAEQDALYAQGRTQRGEIVTRARGGQSNHNFGIAWDVGLFTAQGQYLADSPWYAQVGSVGKALGLDWGGDWESFPDQPHFEVHTGLTMEQKRQRHEAGEPIL